MSPSFLNFVYFIDAILFGLIAFLSFGTIVYTFLQEVTVRKHLYVFTKLKRNFRNLALKSPKAIQTACFGLVNRFSARELLEAISHRGDVIPENLEPYLSDCLLASGKINEIDHLAKQTKNKWQRIEAITALGYIRSPAAVEILSASLLDRDDDISYFAMLALSHIKTPQAAAILIDFLSRHRFSGHKIVSLLESFPPEIASEILKAAEGPDPITRFWMIKLLSKFKQTNYFREIVRFASDSSADVRAAACECLSSLGKKEARSVLVKCLYDDVWFVRMQAVRALSKIAGPESFPQLIELMVKDPSIFVKESVKNAIMKDIDRALPYLSKYLEHGDEATRRYCIDALVDSNYVVKVLRDILSEDPKTKVATTRFLERMIRSGVYFGLKKNLEPFSFSARANILKVIQTIDPHLAERIQSDEA
ncbi:MAG: hypothetical protein A3C35_05095 [Omnitrophica bacterium RIFCSPHIGHO2_02_FULL_46_11]|nr:MAG: hypothetical protein A3C35_05095 [Omnitrophica bacterium RIFCSPHIGHO2_02_FULL_46_11]OGW87807.1 MAG: hypothetical protein A3A81_01790 [Omnitrophica bacterium RIFCSPLOWO2_01_FULL_45_10b]